MHIPLELTLSRAVDGAVGHCQVFRFSFFSARTSKMVISSDFPDLDIPKVSGSMALTARC